MKKSIILLKALIFHYHGLELDEKKLLEQYVNKLDAHEAYEWAISFISEDYLSAYERSKKFLSKFFYTISEEDRLRHLLEIWEDNHIKGYVTEMETTAMINLAKDWSIERSFLSAINH